MKTIKLSTLKLNDRNPRTIKTEAFERLCKSIERDPEFMKYRPIVCDKDRVIIGGNQRYRACVHLGKTEVPERWICFADDMTEEQRKRFILVDNAPDGMAGEWDWDILGADWDLGELKDLGFDELLKEVGENDAGGLDDIDMSPIEDSDRCSKTVRILCAKQDYEDVLACLKEAGASFKGFSLIVVEKS